MNTTRDISAHRKAVDYEVAANKYLITLVDGLNKRTNQTPRCYLDILSNHSHQEDCGGD